MRRVSQRVLPFFTEFAGRATIKDTKKKREVIVTNDETDKNEGIPDPLWLTD